MKRLLSSLSLIAFFFVQISPVLVVAQTAATELNDFEISVPSEVIVNEAFDMTVTALNEAGKKYDKYEGTIFFDTNNSPTDVVLPFENGEYQFTLSDQGTHTFQKGFTLKKAGKYELVVFELDGPGGGVEKVVEVTAVPKGGTTPVKSDIVIKDPATNTTVSTKSVPVSGTSKPTSSVNIKLNGTKAQTTQTDVNGFFSVIVDSLKAGDNVLVAEVLDGIGAVVGTSAPVTIKFSTEVPKLTSLTIKEGGDEFFIGSSITFVGVGDPNLKTVQVKAGESVISLQEDKNKLGTYSGVLKTSEFEGEFKATAVLESQLGVRAEQKDMTKFRTITAEFQNIKIETTPDKKVKFTFELKPDLDQIKYFKIKYGTAAGKYTKEITTYEKSEIKEGITYTWYIPNVVPGEYFSTIIGLDENKKETPINSKEQTFTIALDAAPTCFIEKVSGIRVDRVSDSYSMVRWDNLKEAASYQVFRKDSSGEFAMIDEIKKNEFRVDFNLSSKEVTFADFKIRGICKNGDFTGEGAFSDSVAVPTGPEMIIFFALFMASGIAFIMIRRGYLD
ncbi:hypothetical protein KBB89_01725 [Candidatus Gracilibacteria bacterium]|nr:hypothetical protein [Candidatus Gracilibacteria bacterium]